MTLVLAGCGGAQSEAGKAAPTVPTTTTAAQPSPEHPSPPATQAMPVAPTESENDPALLEKIRALLAAQSQQKLEKAPRLFPLALTAIPTGYTRLEAAALSQKLYLLAINSDQGTVKLLDSLDGALINDVKLDVHSDASTIHTWSQQAFHALSKSADITWDGQHLKLLSSSIADPTRAYFAQEAELVHNGDLDGLMQLLEHNAPLYPNFYSEDYTQAKPTVQFVYQQALARYRAGNKQGALAALRYGIFRHELAYGDLLSQPNTPNAQEHQADQLTLAERIPIANDYAFFLAESGDNKGAEPLLLRVIQLAPDRTVAYLNLGDVEWSLDKPDAARHYYQKYLDLLGPNKAQAPQRVRDRLKP